jgi:hypothetical chaperone protein
MITSAIDFGTTNSVAGINRNNIIEMVQLGKDRLETRSVLFYSFEDKNFYVGDDVAIELEDEVKGRYLQSLKSFLGSKEKIETTLGKDTYLVEDLISIILRRFKNKMETKALQEIDNVVLGRPVRFNEDDDELDKQAEKKLELAANKIGFKNVVFQYEPIAAALAYESKITKEELILVADIGGGTTDYSIIKVGGKNKNKLDRKEDILSNHGIYVGGNNFDSEIIKNFISPYLGRGTMYNIMGKDMEVASDLYFDLSEWHLFQRMFDKKVLLRIEKLIYMSYEKNKIERLQELIKGNLYFDFSNSIINSKIELSSKPLTQINMNMFSDPFSINLNKNNFEESIMEHTTRIEKSLEEALRLANITVNQIDKVFLTGGSTLVPSVQNIYTKYFPKNKIVHTDVFTSVGYGLTLFSNKIKF